MDNLPKELMCNIINYFDKKNPPDLTLISKYFYCNFPTTKTIKKFNHFTIKSRCCLYFSAYIEVYLGENVYVGSILHTLTSYLQQKNIVDAYIYIKKNCMCVYDYNYTNNLIENQSEYTCLGHSPFACSGSVYNPFYKPQYYYIDLSEIN